MARSRKFRIEIEGIDENGRPAAVEILVVIPPIPGLARKYAQQVALSEPPVRRWREVTFIA